MRFPPPSSIHQEMMQLLSSRVIANTQLCRLAGLNYHTFYAWRAKAIEGDAILARHDGDLSSLPPHLHPYLEWWNDLERARAQLTDWASKKATAIALVPLHEGGGVRTQRFEYRQAVETQIVNGQPVEVPLNNPDDSPKMVRVLVSETVKDDPSTLQQILATVDPDKWGRGGKVQVEHSGQVGHTHAHIGASGIGGDIGSLTVLLTHLKDKEKAQLIGLLETAQMRAGQANDDNTKEEEGDKVYLVEANPVDMDSGLGDMLALLPDDPE